jgi:hypothetical protein
MPGSGASASVPRSQAEVEPSSAYRREAAERGRDAGLDAGGELGVRGVGHGADVAVEGVARAVGGDGVHPRQARVLAQHRRELVEIACRAHLPVLAEGARVLQVDVGEGVGTHRRPCGDGGRYQHRAELRLPEGVARRKHAAVRLADVHRHRLGLHVHDLAVVHVRGRLARHDRELTQHEAAGGRDRVAPGEVAVEADVDQREAVDRGAHDVVTAGDGQVHGL